jgi:hypothetical protein
MNEIMTAVVEGSIGFSVDIGTQLSQEH